MAWWFVGIFLSEHEDFPSLKSQREGSLLGITALNKRLTAYTVVR